MYPEVRTKTLILVDLVNTLTQVRLDAHIKQVHAPKEFKCELCDYATSVNQLLKNHIMQVHTMERPFKCPHCDYACVKRGNLKNHINNRHKNIDPT